MNMDSGDAISFANNFFVLADGLVPGIDKYLDKEVILNWFGRTIKGKHKVAAFLNNRKVTTVHTFPTITPSDGFEYQIYQSKKKKVDDEMNNNVDSDEMKDQLKCKNTPNCECPDPKPETDKSKLMSEEKASDGGLNEQHDLNSLNSLDISEMKHAANKTKVEEVMSQFKNMKMKCGHRDDPEVMRNTTSNPMLKCVQARGLLRCSEKLHKPALNSNLHYLNSNHTWTRNCNLSIAYSIGKPQNEKEKNQRERKSSTRSSEGQPSHLLPTFDEVIALSNQVVPNPDHFGGYLQDDYHFYSERRQFLKQFRADISKEKHDDESSSTGLIAGKRLNGDFVFDYSIHYIGYETEGENEVKNEDGNEDKNEEEKEVENKCEKEAKDD